MTDFILTYRPHVLQFRQPAGTSRGVYHHRKVWYVEAHGQYEGRMLYGIGECAPLPDLSCDDLPDYESLLAEACRQTMELGCLPEKWLRPYPSIRMGLETALRSLEACRRCGDPLLLHDTPFARGEKGITINGLVWMGSFEEMSQRMEEKLRAGFRCIKLKIGAIDFERELALVQYLRARYPREVVEIRLDANGAFHPDEAAERLAALAPYDIHSIEQPIRAGHGAAMAKLCRESPIPIALDEELIGVHSRKEKEELLNQIRPAYIILKPSLHGGFAGADEWIHLAEERGIRHWVTSALESNIGLNAIAQWYSTRQPSSNASPQGLGTGQLFVENFNACPLAIEGEQLWRRTAAERAFHAEVQQFMQQWAQPIPTIRTHTSGSTSTPKPMDAQKICMVASARRTLHTLGIRPGSTALIALPLQYIAGQMMLVRCLVGNLLPLTTAPTSRPYAHLLVPPTFAALTPMQALTSLRHPSDSTLLKQTPVVIIGGGSISDELLTRVQDCSGAVYSSYGMTETLSHIALRRLNGPTSADTYTPLPGVEISIDAEGCLCLYDPTVHPAHLHTRDLAECYPDGTFRILGRKDNVVCSGGLKFQIEVLETRLSALSGAYALTAVPDPLLGEALTLLYTGSEAEARALCRRVLTPHEQPRHFFTVSSLPLTTTGKVNRPRLRELALQYQQSSTPNIEESPS